MSPQMFESLLFLKENSRLRDPALVPQAINMAKSSRAKKTLDEMDAYENGSLSLTRDKYNDVQESVNFESESESNSDIEMDD